MESTTHLRLHNLADILEVKHIPHKLKLRKGGYMLSTLEVTDKFNIIVTQDSVRVVVLDINHDDVRTEARVYLEDGILNLPMWNQILRGTEV